MLVVSHTTLAVLVTVVPAEMPVVLAIRAVNVIVYTRSYGWESTSPMSTAITRSVPVVAGVSWVPPAGGGQVAGGFGSTSFAVGVHVTFRS